MLEILLLLLLKKRMQRKRMLFATKNNNKKKRQRRWWVRPINTDREKYSEFRRLTIDLKLHDEEWFFQYTRMTPRCYDELLSMVGPVLKKSSIRTPLSPSARLAITLRFLATGDSYSSLANSYHIGKSTVCSIIQEVTEQIWLQLGPKILPPLTTKDFEKVALDFLDRWQMPHCIGSIDGKHIAIIAPPNSGSLFYNYKNHFSIILLGLCDADYNFLYVDIGCYGSVSDGGVFSSSNFGQALKNNTLPLPPPEVLPGTNYRCNYYFVGDAAFPLGKHLMRPYSGKMLEILKSVFNYRLSRARRVIENTFGILVSRWRIYHRTISASPNTVDNIIKATVCLHNFIRKSASARSRYTPSNYVDTEDVLGAWREEVENSIVQNCRRLGSNNASKVYDQHRYNLEKYFLTPEGFKRGQIEYV